MKKYLHIGFHFSGKVLSTELEPMFRLMADDWIRYASSSWIVWTAKSPAEWFNALKPLIGSTDQMLILELKTSQSPIHGWLPQWIWNWLQKSRT